jgi:hypothetical protein
MTIREDRAVLTLVAGLALVLVVGILPAAEGMLAFTFPSKVSHAFEAIVLWPAVERLYQGSRLATATGMELSLAVGTIAGLRGLRREGFTRRTTGLLACAGIVAAIFCLAPWALYLQTRKTMGLMDESSAEGLAYMRSHLEHPAGLASGDREQVRRLWNSYAQAAYVWSGRIVQIPQGDGTFQAFQPADSDEELRRKLAAMRGNLVPPFRDTAILAARLGLYLLLGGLTPISRRVAAVEVPARSTA